MSFFMNDSPLTLQSWPHAILHLDADNFFASVEQVLNPKLKGLPVITGAERGIITAASQEAKARGVLRGVRIADAKKLCPELVCVESDYENYALFSCKIFSIIRRFTPAVEEYSIDEAFADLSGLRRMHHSSYAEIGRQIKQAVERELGLTVSVGVSISKVLAKLCSKYQKPSGLTVVSGPYIHRLLKTTPLGKVWGFGKNSVALLEKQGLKTAFDFVRKPESFAQSFLGKPGIKIHRELSGILVDAVNPHPKTSYASISKSKTFSPPSIAEDFVYAELLSHLESACAKARRYGLSANKLTVFLKQQNFKISSVETCLANPTSSTMDLVPLLASLFRSLYKDKTLYRATGVTLSGLQTVTEKQLDLFENNEKSRKHESIDTAIDQIRLRFGKHSIHLANTLSIQERLKKKRRPSLTRGLPLLSVPYLRR